MATAMLMMIKWVTDLLRKVDSSRRVGLSVGIGHHVDSTHDGTERQTLTEIEQGPRRRLERHHSDAVLRWPDVYRRIQQLPEEVLDELYVVDARRLVLFDAARRVDDQGDVPNTRT